MRKAEIDIDQLKIALDTILEHVMVDLQVEKVAIEENEDFYWSCPPRERYDVSKQPSEWWTGRLSDDLDFTKLIRHGQSGDISYNLVHVAPLLQYIAEKIRNRTIA